MAKKVNLPVDLESIYNDYIKYENDVNVENRYKGKEEWYHASGAGTCSRKLYYQSVEKREPSNETDARSNRIMRLGTILHNDLENALILYNNKVYNNIIYNKKEKDKSIIQKEKIKFHTEEEVTIDDLKVRGFYDIVADVYGKIYLIDLKSIGSFAYSLKFGRKSESNPSQHYELQLGTYGNAVKEKFGRLDGMYLAFYNKDTSRLRFAEVPMSYLNLAWNFWKNINEEHKAGLPMFNMGTSPVQKWNCGYCPYLEICNPPFKLEK